MNYLSYQLAPALTQIQLLLQRKAGTRTTAGYMHYHKTHQWMEELKTVQMMPIITNYQGRLMFYC